MGQASPQPMVITTSEDCTASAVRTFGVCAEMSMPTSAIAATADGLTWSPGMLPAERTSTSPPPRWARKPAAIWERPALCTQTNRTLGLSAMGYVPFEEDHRCQLDRKSTRLNSSHL